MSYELLVFAITWQLIPSIKFLFFFFGEARYRYTRISVVRWCFGVMTSIAIILFNGINSYHIVSNIMPWPDNRDTGICLLKMAILTGITTFLIFKIGVWSIESYQNQELNNG